LGWVEAKGASAGRSLWLDLPHVGVRGEAVVEAVGPCPEVARGPGRLVTGTFRRSQARVVDMHVGGEPSPVGVTPRHPFWSVDRNGWVPAGDLRVGERLRAGDGSTPRVESFAPRPEPEPVYNIEVEGKHCYRVGQQGLLVHNQSLPVVNLGDPVNNSRKPCVVVVTQPFETSQAHTAAGFVYQYIRFADNIMDCCDPPNEIDLATFSGGQIPAAAFYEWWDAPANQILYDNDNNNLPHAIIQMTQGRLRIAGTFRFCEGQPNVVAPSVGASGALGSSLSDPTLPNLRCGRARSRRTVMIVWNCCTDPGTTTVTFS
jgi:hypothetical protein